MQIAIIGAGRIGSTFAFHLARAGHQLTLVARGSRLEQLQREGAIISVTGDQGPVFAAASLDATMAFDLVLVTVMAHQVDALLPALEASPAKTIVFMFNTFETVDRLRELIGAERCAFGFPNMAAFFVDGRLKSTVNGPGMVTTLSSPQWAETLKKAGLPTEVENDMNSFLRSHVAFVVPLFAAALLTWQRPTELTWAEASKLSGALVEGLNVVRFLGQALKPGFVAALGKLPRPVLTFIIFVFARTQAIKGLGAFGPSETRALIDAMTAAAPGKTTQLVSIRP